MATATCGASDLDALLSPPCAASALVPAAAAALFLAVSAVRLGQVSAPRATLLTLPARTANARALALLAGAAAAVGAASVRWPASGWLERAAATLAAAGWTLALLVALVRAPGGGWAVAASAAAAAAAAVPDALALARAPVAAPWTDAAAPLAHVAVAACQLGAAAALAVVACAERARWLPTVEAPPLLEPLLGAVAAVDEAGSPSAAPLPSSGVCPERASGLVSRVMFAWMSPTLRIGARRALGLDDLWQLDEPDRAEALSAAWARAPRGSSCARRLYEVVGSRFASGAIFRLLSDSAQLGTPIVLNRLLAFLQAAEGEGALGYGVGMAFLLFASQLCQSLCDNQYFWRVLRCGIHARVVLIGQISAKVLRLSHSARARHSTGRLNALIAADAEAVELCLGTLHLCWSAVLRIIVALVLLYGQLGPSAFAALGALLMLVPLQTVLVMRSARAQKRGLQHTDERVRALSEAVGAITTLKCYAWEAPALARVLACRDLELGWLRVRVVLNGLNFAMLSLNLTLMAAATFSAYTLSGGTLDASTTFTAIALFGNLQGPLFLVPQAISQAVSARVSLRRLDELLLADELPELAAAEWTEVGRTAAATAATAAAESQGSARDVGSPPPDGIAIELRGADFSWDADGGAGGGAGGGGRGGGATSPLLAADGGGADGGAPAPTLRSITLRVQQGSLLAVVGGSGEGKSSLLSAILGDLPAVLTHLAPRTRGRIAYCAQVSWVFPGSVRDNILFGRPYESQAYEHALWAADLGADLQQMGGDGAELGERGVNLSGGQKQRVSLARALYADADIYVLDDVLSALDAAVAARIFDRLLIGAVRARGRTCVFATNRLEFVSRCSHVAVLKDGALLDVGPVPAVRERCEAFAALMASGAGSADGADADSGARGADDAAGGSANGASAAAAEHAPAPQAANAPNGAAAPPPPPSARTLVELEHREKGQLSMRVVAAYLRAAGGTGACALIVALFALKTGCDYTANWWLSRWSAASDGADGGVSPLGGGPHDAGWWLGGYLLVQLCGVCLTLAAQLSLALGGLRASADLARRLSSALLSAPLSFFHANPTGRLLNVATKDQRDVDQVLVTNLAITLMISFNLLATLVVIMSSLWWTAILIVPLIVFFVRTRNTYQRSLIEIKRWGAVTRSPVYVHFAQCLDGLFTIRAYGAQQHMLARTAELIDANARWDLAEQAASRWLSMRLAWIGGLVTLACALGSVALAARAGPAGAAAAGLMLSYALNLSFALIMVTRLSSQTENSFNAVERVLHYGETPPENGGLDAGPEPPAGWPSAGRLEFARVSVRYRPHQPDVLTDLSFTVGAGDKVGIVGRTGAGKSSLVLALFRLVQPYRGAILIDGVDALRMRLSSLRSRLGIIPQEPVLLCGSVRYNLDPFNDFTDLQLWAALRQAHLAEYVAAQPARLDAEIAEGGSNLSIGQRQLLCMARALARSCRVLVMDEATAAVDTETDRLIQSSLRLAFSHATVLTIAHRLHTVIDSTHALLLAQGRLVEFGSPHTLLSDRASHFSQLVDSTGEAAAAALRAAAASVAAGGVAERLPLAAEPSATFAPPPPPPRAPFAKQPSGRLRSAAFATLAAVRVQSGSGSGMGGRRETGDSTAPSVGAGGGGLLSPGSSVAAPSASLDAVRASIDQLSAAVREGAHGSQWLSALAASRVSRAEWYAELCAVLGALAREAERARVELEDEDGAHAEHAGDTREDRTLLSTHA